jgi:guanylate kinase
MTQLRSNYIVFSAPSGAGKTTIIKVLLEEVPGLALSISATTRSRRKGEQNGKDYFFLSKAEFEKAIQENRFLEYETVHDNLYGTLKDKVSELVKEGQSVVFDIDVKGAKAIKEHYPQAILIFIMPPNEKILKQRLINRKSEDHNTLKRRLERLEYEYRQADLFDYKVINDSLKDAVAEVKRIITENETRA